MAAGGPLGEHRAAVLDVVGDAVRFDDLSVLLPAPAREISVSPGSRVAKRAFDLACAVSAIVVLAPLLAIIAVAIKLDSPGPVLFRQVRVGRRGDRFRICKFRTMVADAEHRKAELAPLNEAAPGLFKIRDDPRITAVGRLLRRTCLDELPQLINVIRGEMSLVGPRPLIESEDEMISDRRRLHLRPGMTGHWQILGSSRVSLQEMVKIDASYAAGWSLLRDIEILLRTAVYAACRRGM